MRTLLSTFSACLVIAPRPAEACPPPNYPPGYVAPSLEEKLADTYKRADTVLVALISDVSPTGGPDEVRATLLPKNIFKGTTDGLLFFDYSTKWMHCGHIQPVRKNDLVLYYIERRNGPFHLISQHIKSLDDPSVLITQKLQKAATAENKN